MDSFRYRFETQGERLYSFVRDWMSGYPRNELRLWYEQAGLTENWVEYVAQLSTVSVSGRIVAAGRSIKKRYSNDQLLFRREYRTYLNDYLLISKSDLDDLMDKAVAAVRVADGKIPDGLKKDRRAWAAKSHPYCYMCNAVLSFSDDKADDFCTIEHLWPSSYGGDSISENLLPACKKCNESRKANFATWATTSVQSVLRGFDEDTAHKHFISGQARYALHQWAGQQYAIKNMTNLQTAFRRIGPWVEPRIKDPGDVAHFFNLQNHTKDVAID